MTDRKNLDFIDFRNGISHAHQRIARDIRWTPLEFSPALSRLAGARVHVKWENQQLSGSFKLRGALNKLRTMGEREKQGGLISASTGNHGLGLSLAARKEGVKLTLVLPAGVTGWKKSQLKDSGATILEVAESCEKAEIFARQLAAREKKTYVSPYNDLDVIFGQGTIGVEILTDLPATEVVFIPVGGGGLAAGIAGYLKAINPGIQVFGVEPLHSAFMAASIRAGKIVEVEEKRTVADAVAGGIEPDSITFPLCQHLLDGIVLVEENAIEEAMNLLWENHGQVVEGAGALALAGALAEKRRFNSREVVLIASGGNRPN